MASILKKFGIAAAVFLTTGSYSYAQSPVTNTRKQVYGEMKRSMVDELLKQWYPAAIDTTYGGFLSTFSFDFKPQGAQDKMIVTQARHVWSNARAAELYPSVSYYSKGAAQGFQFLKNVLWDKQYGGFYTYTDRQGKPKNGGFAPKEAYGNSFALYAIAAYYHQSGDTSALNLAIKQFNWLEQHAHDPVYKGYYQHMELDGTPIKRTAATPSRAETGYKDQNTSIHLLEAFTELYRVWPDKLLKERLQEMLFLIRDKIVTPKGNLTLFFQPDWTPVNNRDSSEAYILSHRGLDHVSFGHDVETAYLMLEASHLLGLKNDVTTHTVAKRMVDHALKNGWDNTTGGFYDEGYYFKDKPGITIIADTKNWWAQAEGLNTLLMFDDMYPTDSLQYGQKFYKLWNYTQTYLIDHEHGDWYQGGIDKQPNYKAALKGQIWKGTYHVLRAFINCTNRLQPDKQAPTAPQKISFKGFGNRKQLSWQAAKDNTGLYGYNIYLNGQRIAFTPLTHWQPLTGQAWPKGKLSVKSVDLEENESMPATLKK
ncbi:AGE family epimerase/isomerase [Mucilaginibacter sp. ZT4R22]|uniref:AGE family epimerase/isomerase n=1 Tax=Mucilaginibacter pankratovii TaxID=2772110 RepID=A0ABR7WT60_9SPHI|nr:AGE family epimerase/isomerase [Mucilaginibacter pankratovii]MBD1365436.1 AGE family epimerase/isomerase [Mucilaginibacter pankratovii]